MLRPSLGLVLLVVVALLVVALLVVALLTLALALALAPSPPFPPLCSR